MKVGYTLILLKEIMFIIFSLKNINLSCPSGISRSLQNNTNPILVKKKKKFGLRFHITFLLHFLLQMLASESLTNSLSIKSAKSLHRGGFAAAALRHNASLKRFYQL